MSAFWKLPLGLWKGDTAIILGNGASLPATELRNIERKGKHFIAINDACRAAPFAEIVYAGDAGWWRENYESTVGMTIQRLCGDVEAAANLPDDVLVVNVDTKATAIVFDDPDDGIVSGNFSGYQAIQIAWRLGATSIALLGFDCAPIAGRTHWFGDPNVADLEKMTRLGPQWEESLQKLIAELADRSVTVGRAALVDGDAGASLVIG